MAKRALKLVSISRELSDEKSKKEKEILGSKTKEFLSEYCDQFKIKYKCYPEEIRDPKIRGRVQHFLKSTPIDRAKLLIQVYFQMHDQYFSRRHYDIETFLRNLNRIGIALSTGRDPDDPLAFGDDGGTCA